MKSVIKKSVQEQCDEYHDYIWREAKLKDGRVTFKSLGQAITEYRKQR
jgi:hypothetical protein